MRELERSAIVVIPKQPLLDWLNFVDPEGKALTIADVQTDPTVYLIPEIDCDEDLGRFLMEHGRRIFEEQLEEWISDDTLWPVDRSFEVFSRWFAISLHSVVVDFNVKRFNVKR